MPTSCIGIAGTLAETNWLRPGLRISDRVQACSAAAVQFNATVRKQEFSGIELCYIHAGKPNQNAFIEPFNRGYREEVLTFKLPLNRRYPVASLSRRALSQ